jgi:23S rRNA-/tRNA-specific pseudouridylate synthase
MTAAPPLTFTLNRPAPRLDAWLAAAHPAISRSRWKQLIESGRVTLNGAPALKPNTPLAPGDTLACTLPPPEPAGLLPADIPLDILYEDADLIVLNKPPGLVLLPAPGPPPPPSGTPSATTARSRRHRRRTPPRYRPPPRLDTSASSSSPRN